MSLLTGIIEPLVETVRAEAQNMLSDVEEQARAAVQRITRTVRLVITECLLWFAAAALLFAGIIVFLTRFFPTDAVLIGTALLLAYAALLIRMIR